jgi:glycosyltransferase involved in cell wall biosynthesis
MNIIYVANMRLPTEKAHGVQIMKACEALVKRGHALSLWVPRRKTPIKEDPFTYYGIKQRFLIRSFLTLDTVSFGTLGFVLQSILFALRARLSLPACDIVYGRDEIVLATLALLGVRTIIWESHDGSWNRWARILAKRARGIIVVSNGARDIYIERGIDPARIAAVPNGIDLEDFAHPESKEAARKRLGLPHDTMIAMYIGRLDGWKGSDTFLEAAKKVSGMIEAVVIGGEGPQVTALSAAYPEVRFLGFHPYRELVDNQAAADMLIVPNTAKDPISVTFTSPLKLFAHMASGRPVIASDLPSIKEIAGDTAFLIPPDDADALGDMMLYVAAHREEAESLASAARERVGVYGWESRAIRLEASLRGMRS